MASMDRRMTDTRSAFRRGFDETYNAMPGLRWIIARRIIGIVLIIAGMVAMIASISERDMYLLVYGIAMIYFGDKL